MARSGMLMAHARERYRLPDEWQWYRLERLGAHPDYIGTLITGAVCAAVFTRGARKGTPNWSRRDRTTEASIPILDADHKEWLLAWEVKTGQCHRCEGAGEEWGGWNKEKGNWSVPCRRCDATGKAPTPAPVEDGKP